MPGDTAVTKDLNYYLNGHMDEMPSDPAEIEKLASAATSQALETAAQEKVVDEPARAAAAAGDASAVAGDGKTTTEGAATTETQGSAAVKTDGDKPTGQDKGGEGGKGEDRIDGVLLKDGKRVLPYEVHHAVRMRAQNAETTVVEQAQEIQTLRDQVTQLKAGKQVDTTAFKLMSQEDIDAVKSEMPALGAVMESQNNAIKALVETVTDLRQNHRAAAVDTAEVSEAQQLIDQIPTLAKWNAGGSADMDKRWDKALAYDKDLLNDPDWKDKPDTERFEKVVAMTKAYFGDKPDDGDHVMAAGSGGAAGQDKEALARQAKEKLEREGGGGNARMPSTLSDIPGGAPAATDEAGKLEGMSAAALGAHFMRVGATGGADAISAHLRSL